MNTSDAERIERELRELAAHGLTPRYEASVMADAADLIARLRVDAESYGARLDRRAREMFEKQKWSTASTWNELSDQTKGVWIDWVIRADAGAEHTATAPMRAEET